MGTKVDNPVMILFGVSLCTSTNGFDMVSSAIAKQANVKQSNLYSTYSTQLTCYLRNRNQHGSALIKGLLGPSAPQYCSARHQDGGETGSDLLPCGEDGGGKLKHDLTKEERRSEEKDQPHDQSRLRARAFCWCGNTQHNAI